MSAPACLVGIDLGTTVCKALVFDQDLRLLAGASRPLALSTLSGAEIEQDAEGWWQSAARVVREALGTSGCDARQVKGLGVSSQGISFVPVDGSGAPLRPAFSWLDTRAVEQRRAVVDALGEKRIFSITGKRCGDAYLLPKLLWFREHEPAAWAKTRRILMPLDFLLARLTGEYVTDHTMASGTMLYDITRRQWSQRILAAFDFDQSILPGIHQGGETAGELRPASAEALGLPAGIPVAVGGQDQKVAALGAGIDLDRCTISLGTAMAITQKCDQPVIDPAMRIPCFTDLLPGRWVVEGSAVCCSILDWAKQAFFPGSDWDELNRLVGEAAGLPNAPTMLPFFSGAAAPFFDPAARGTLTGLDLSTTPAQIVRSVYEGIAFLIRANIEVIESISRPVRGLRIFGGGSKSDAWCRIIADTVQRPVSALAISESASVGAAILAGTAGGVFSNPEDAFPLVAVRSSYEPRPDHAARCDEGYGRFCSLADQHTRSRAPALLTGCSLPGSRSGG
ncbi:MAG: FGGY family carbohydrate kinase [Spirochaetes bacterium]|nr:FGGY family carbohydrate kinase [Spirochaetota bacterium]